MSKYYQNKARVLIKMKRFQKEVKKFRLKFGIPENGFQRSERSKWYYGYGGKPDMTWSEVRRKLRLDVNRELLPKRKEFLDELEIFARKFNLDEKWYMALFSHFVSGGKKLDYPDNSVSVEARLKDARVPEDKWEVTHLWIDLSKDTTIKDIEAVWDRVQKYQSKMKASPSDKRKPFQDSNVQKYVRVRDLEDSGLSQKEIADQYPGFYFSTASDVATYKRDIEKPFKPRVKK